MIHPIAASGKAQRPTVLLVEDDDLIRTSTAEMVRDLGYPVVDARSAEEAMALIGLADVGVLMADIGLPGMSGDVFAAQALIGRRMGIVFATGNEHVRGDPTDETGPVLLRKPYDTAAIQAALEKALTRASS